MLRNTLLSICVATGLGMSAHASLTLGPTAVRPMTQDLWEAQGQPLEASALLALRGLSLGEATLLALPAFSDLETEGAQEFPLLSTFRLNLTGESIADYGILAHYYGAWAVPVLTAGWDLEAYLAFIDARFDYRYSLPLMAVGGLANWSSRLVFAEVGGYGSLAGPADDSVASLSFYGFAPTQEPIAYPQAPAVFGLSDIALVNTESGDAPSGSSPEMTKHLTIFRLRLDPQSLQDRQLREFLSWFDMGGWAEDFAGFSSVAGDPGVIPIPESQATVLVLPLVALAWVFRRRLQRA